MDVVPLTLATLTTYRLITASPTGAMDHSIRDAPLRTTRGFAQVENIPQAEVRK